MHDNKLAHALLCRLNDIKSTEENDAVENHWS